MLESQLINNTHLSNSSGEFLHVARQFLANTPVLETRETYTRELGFFISWYGKDGSIANIELEDLLKYKVMLETQYSPATVSKKIAAIKSFVIMCGRKY